MFLVKVFVEDLIKVFVEFHQKVKVLNEDLNEVFNEDLFYGTALCKPTGNLSHVTTLVGRAPGHIFPIPTLETCKYHCLVGCSRQHTFRGGQAHSPSIRVALISLSVFSCCLWFNPILGQHISLFHRCMDSKNLFL